jgi:hypothetical protein
MMIKYVVDLETAKKLKDYLLEGFRSGLEWVYHHTCGKWDVRKTGIMPNFYETLPAPILEEMLELLPDRVKQCDAIYERILTPSSISYESNAGSLIHQGEDHIPKVAEFTISGIYNANPSTAAAKLYMWLVDEGYVAKASKQ